ncbi:MAG: serine/threonine protein kinase [Rhodospirillales bacterium]|nr:serine/threonine protein kinase [Rhodospirillales bacterium]
MTEEALPQGFGRYRPVAMIGAGGIGTVFKAHDPLIDRLVAIKVIRTDMLPAESRAEYLDRFRTEAQAGGRCSHPAIVAIFDAGEADGAPYLVMEFIEGRSLHQLLAEPHGGTLLDILRLMEDVLAGLACAHERGVIHRDIKPANVMVTPDGRAKIADFGIARLDRGHATQIGDMLGTPSYMAPEQVDGGAVDRRADLFSAAAILHTMLLGRPPFAGRSLPDTLLRLTDAAEVDLAALEGGPQAAFAPVLRQGLAKQPAARFATAEAFAAALRAAASVTEDATLVQPGRARPVDAVLAAAAEAELARHVGPIARVHAAQAARLALDEADFLTRLARHIPDAAQATRFLRERAAGAPAPAAPTISPRQLSTQEALGLAAGRGISPAALEAARAALAPYAGPIARVLVSQAVRDSPSLDALVERLASAVPQPGDAAAFRRTLRATLEKSG